MNLKYACGTLLLVYLITETKAVECGCRQMRSCYSKMIKSLRTADEVACIEDAAVGASTLQIFLKALKIYCGQYLTLLSNDVTYQDRRLFEVVVTNNVSCSSTENKPTIIIDAGQDGREMAVRFALYIIEQLIACTEHDDMLNKFRWVILPCTNPDGLEYDRFSFKTIWRKNVRTQEDGISLGVDITQNFDCHWDACEQSKLGFSQYYQGPSPASEKETIFIQNVLGKYAQHAKAYVSIRSDGHAILYPYAYTKKFVGKVNVTKVAALMALKVNQRAGSVYSFRNESIYSFNGKPYCGHSVDFAYDLGIPLAFEMKVFDETDDEILKSFFTLPKGYETSLRSAYFNGIRELYSHLKTTVAAKPHSKF